MASETGLGHFSVQAANVEEAAEAVKHYYGCEHLGNNMSQTCPLCRAVNKKFEDFLAACVEALVPGPLGSR